ncbi:hypothetical protein D3C80_1758160 [compost metagenome]
MEDGAGHFQLLANFWRIDDVAVRRDRKISIPIAENKRLGIRQLAFSRCRIPNVTDGAVTRKQIKLLLVKHFLHKPHVAVIRKFIAISGIYRTNTGTFFTAMLKGMQTVIGEIRCMGEVKYPEYAAFLTKLIKYIVTANALVIMISRP